jgi:hypothetical protein
MGGSSQANDFTRTLLYMNLTFLGFNLPKVIVYIIRDVYVFSGAPKSYFDAFAAQMDMFWNVVFNVATFYYVISFPLNMRFNKVFRKEVCMMMPVKMRRTVFATSLLDSSNVNNKTNKTNTEQK